MSVSCFLFITTPEYTALNNFRLASTLFLSGQASIQNIEQAAPSKPGAKFSPSNTLSKTLYRALPFFALP